MKITADNLKTLLVLLTITLIVPAAFVGLSFSRGIGIYFFSGILLLVTPVLCGYLAVLRPRLYTILYIIFLISCAVVEAFFAYRPNWLQIPLMFSCYYYIAAAVIALIFLFVHWGKGIFLAITPVILTIGGFYLQKGANQLGHWYRIEVFNSRFTQYEQFVDILKKDSENKQFITLSGEQIPEQYRSLAYCVHAHKEKDVFVVVFAWGLGFPAKHSAFAYRSDGILPSKGSEFRREWPFCERINENWFRVAD
jgi:hypothetical protein